MKLPSAVGALCLACCLLTGGFALAAAPDYAKQVAPLLRKYCVSCHNAEDPQGEFSMQSFAELQRGGEHGAAIVPRNAAASRLIQVLSGGEPAMPPDDSPAPTAAEIALLASWIDAGARGPDGAEPAWQLDTPRIAPLTDRPPPVTAVDWSATGLLAVGQFEHVELRPDDADHAVPLGRFPGKVYSVRFSQSGNLLATCSGTTGLNGWAGLWSTTNGKLLGEFRGHRDAIFTAAISPDGKLLATGSYDRQIILWNAETAQPLRTLTGHNGAIYDLDFSPDGAVLASASGDQTVKLWRVADGQRLDTLSQPLKEQYTVRFRPDGKQLVAGGADNRIRVWKFVSRSKPRINPLLHARFAHEGAVTHLRFTADGSRLVSAAEDRTLKVWDTSGYTQQHAYPRQPDQILALAVSPISSRLVVGRMDGSLQQFPLPEIAKQTAANRRPATSPAPEYAETPPPSPQPVDEQEPNDTRPQQITAPAIIRGAIDGDDRTDTDLFRFTSRGGQSWMLEINAARSKSPLDSRIEVLTADGQPIRRLLLQAVRDSYFTFRGKNSSTSDDFRLHNWQEMELNEFLYCNGEVVKLWHYPRGPDSGFIVYPGSGSRHTFFGTSPMAHALQEPCYIVEPLAPEAEPVPNGLPVFPVYYENDDDGLRRWGADSRLEFTAPADGDYLVRVSDVRGQQGPDYKYQLTIRPRRPDFKVSLSGANPTVPAGSGQEFTLKVQREDGFDGPVRVEIDGLPAGFRCTSPILIQAGQQEARGVLRAATDAAQPADDHPQTLRVVAKAKIGGTEVERPVNSLGKITLGPRPKVLIQVVHKGQQQIEGPDSPIELTIAPGQTISAEVVAQRLGYNGRLSMGKHDAGRNLPHGVYVDNVGLNGLMIVDGQTRREFFITAAPWVPAQTRHFHLRVSEAGGQTSQPVILHVTR